MQRFLFVALTVLTLPLVIGCEGCRPAPTNPNAANEESEQAPRAAYSIEPAIVFPDDQNSTFGAVKPGHWMTAAQSLRSNKADMRGQLRSQSSVAIQNVEMETTGTVRSRESIRPVVLPKGQMRQFDYRFLCPVPNSVETKRLNLSSRLVPRSGGVFDTGGQPFNVMQGSEYYFVVLTQRPERFARLQTANWVRFEESEMDRPLELNNYRIAIPEAGGLLPLPETMLDMTCIGAILWDDVSEDALTPMQQSALADWVRFGGRLIVNGPLASDALANTAVADLLPLFPTSNIELDQDAAIKLLQTWSVQTDRSLEKQVEYVRSEGSRVAIDGRLEPGAKAVEKTSSLVIAKRVGRGNVIQPRFDVTEAWVESWDSYDSFFNGVILNRPPREFIPMLENADSLSDLSLYFKGTRRRSDAAVNTQVRIAARDAMLLDMEDERRPSSPYDTYVRTDAMTGISGWTDGSDVVTLFRDALTSEAGIKIPDSSLVINSLVIYLIVLVPINYLVFRVMNRLEYAWFAVPVIAVVGAILAARQAQLDIGFARSNTELSLLELHGDYARGHLTRLVGVYNSLSSRYEVQFPSADGIASPFEDEPDPGTTVDPIIKTSFESGPSLDDFAVASNRMRYLHTEEIISIGGRITWDGKQTIQSDADLDLLDAMVIRKDDDGVCTAAIVGALAPGDSKTLEFVPAEQLGIPAGLPMKTTELLRRFTLPTAVPEGSVRLVARIDGSLDGYEISPNASQLVAQTVVLVHLDYEKLAAPEVDVNLASDFRRVNRLDDSKPDDDAATSESP